MDEFEGVPALNGDGIDVEKICALHGAKPGLNSFQRLMLSILNIDFTKYVRRKMICWEYLYVFSELSKEVNESSPQ